MRIHSSEEVREIDAHAASTLGVPVASLMENAGRAVAEAAEAMLGKVDGRGRGQRPPTVFVVCGKGNNGGDGFVAARHLHSRSVPVRLLSLAPIDTLTGLALQSARAARACGVRETSSLDEAREGDVVVDAIFGTGLSRPPAGDALHLIDTINDASIRGARVLAVDLPSGVDADRPHLPGAAVRADSTLALHCLKPAHLQYPSRSFCGEVQVADIGIPSMDAPGPDRRLLTRRAVSALLPGRPDDAHKGTAGHVVVVAGSPGKSGAAMLAAMGALRAGAGLVTVASSPVVLDRILPNMPEVMGHPVERWTPDALLEALDGKDAWVAGPGMERDDSTGSVLVHALRETSIPACFDADALNALAMSPESQKELAALPLPKSNATPVPSEPGTGDSDLPDTDGAKGHRPLLMTPHPAELARLLGTTTAAVQADRFAAASDAAERFGAVVILKGAFSVIAHPDGTLRVNPTGTPAMATAGAGDVLAGVCGALLAQGLSVFPAATVATWVHGAAGARASGGRDRGLVASDVIDALPSAIAELV